MLVGLGGAIGSIVRFLLSFCFLNAVPWVILSINISGGFLIGILARLLESIECGETLKAFWIVGFCGGFTTFSTFGYDCFNFIRSDQFTHAILYVGLSVAGTILAVFIGYRVFS